MTWGMDAIRGAYMRGSELNASHMIVVHNNVDFDQMAVYVMPGQSPREVFAEHQAENPGWSSVDECYRYELGWVSQSKERRAIHWEWTPVSEGTSPVQLGRDGNPK